MFCHFISSNTLYSCCLSSLPRSSPGARVGGGVFESLSLPKITPSPQWLFDEG